MSEVWLSKKLDPNWAEIYGVPQVTVLIRRVGHLWIAEVPEVGVLAHGRSKVGTLLEVLGLMFRVLVDRADAHFGGPHWRDEDWAKRPGGRA